MSFADMSKTQSKIGLCEVAQILTTQSCFQCIMLTHLDVEDRCMLESLTLEAADSMCTLCQARLSPAGSVFPTSLPQRAANVAESGTVISSDFNPIMVTNESRRDTTLISRSRRCHLWTAMKHIVPYLRLVLAYNTRREDTRDVTCRGTLGMTLDLVASYSTL